MNAEISELSRFRKGPNDGGCSAIWGNAGSAHVSCLWTCVRSWGQILGQRRCGEVGVASVSFSQAMGVDIAGPNVPIVRSSVSSPMSGRRRRFGPRGTLLPAARCLALSWVRDHLEWFCGRWVPGRSWARWWPPVVFAVVLLLLGFCGGRRGHAGKHAGKQGCRSSRACRCWCARRPADRGRGGHCAC